MTSKGETIALEASRQRKGIEILIKDCGPGVPTELRDAIFEPVTSTRPQGTGGLGLAISKRLIEAAGGSLLC